MNRERAKELLPIIEAYANGEEIEWFDPDEHLWIPASSPIFHDVGKYRIKPKPLECWVTFYDDCPAAAYLKRENAVFASRSGRNGRVVRMVEQPEDGQNN